MFAKDEWVLLFACPVLSSYFFYRPMLMGGGGGGGMSGFFCLLFRFFGDINYAMSLCTVSGLHLIIDSNLFPICCGCYSYPALYITVVSVSNIPCLGGGFS